MKTLTDDHFRAALAPLRPDPIQFREATLAKIAGRTKSEASPARAASMLPLHLVFGLSKGTSVTKGAGAWLSLPVVSLAAVAVTFAWSLNRVLRRPGNSGAATESSADELVRNWWNHHGASAVAALLLLLVVALFLPAMALLGLVLGSMVQVALVVGRLRANGQANGVDVGRILSQFLGLYSCVLLVTVGWGKGWDPADLRIRVWVPMVLLGASFLCEWLGGLRSRSALGRLAGLVPLIIFALIVGKVLVPRMQRPDRPRATLWAETFDEPVENTVEWLRLGRITDWLQRDRPLRLAPARALLRHAQKSGRTIPWATRNGAALAGLLPVENGDDPDMQLRPAGVERTLAEFERAVAGDIRNPISRARALHGGVRLAERRGTLANLDLETLHRELSTLASPGWLEALMPTYLPRLSLQAYRIEAAVALLRLEESSAWAAIPAQDRSAWNSASLALLAALLLAGLCCAVTVRAEFSRVESGEKGS